MPQVKYYPKGSVAGQTFGTAALLPNDYDASKKYMLWIVGHGAGETGDGSITALQKVVNWGGWSNLKTAVDTYKFIAVFVNTASRYDKLEYQFALEWAKKTFPIALDSIWLLGHSLGSYGAGNFAFTDATFTKQLNGWLISSTGGFTERDTLYNNIVTNKLKVWGVTAQNDSVVPYTYVTRVKTALIARDSQYPVIVTVFPSTTWPDGIVAHNATINRLTSTSTTQLYYPGTSGKLITNTTGFKMNVYQWALSNPKGSIYQPPTDSYVGPKYESPLPAPDPTPAPAPVTVNQIGFTVSHSPITGNQVLEVFWDNSTPKDTYKIRSMYYSKKSKRIDATLTDGSVKSIYETKQV